MEAQTLTVVSGNGQVVQEQFQTIAPLVVQAKDASGRPLANVTINWRITQGSGTVPGIPSVTDAGGLAGILFLATSLPPNISYLPATVTAASQSASVDFTVTTVPTRKPDGGQASPPLATLLAPPLENRAVSGRSGTTLPGAVKVSVTAQNGIGAGQGIPNVGLRVENSQDPATQVAFCNAPGGVVFTNAQGVATCDLVITGASGMFQLAAVAGESLNRPTFSLQITPGVACTYTLSASSQSFSASGGSGSVNVSAASACAWTASSNATWIAIGSGAAGAGSGALNYTVSANPTGFARTGALSIAGQTYTVAQSAAGSGTPLSIVPGALTATVNVPSSAALSAMGGAPPYVWSLMGALPGGLVLNSATGAISGLPAAAGQYTFVAVVMDAAGANASQSFTINVAPAGSPSFVVSTASLPGAAVGQPYTQTLVATGGCITPFAPVPVFSLASGALPDGLSLMQAPSGQFQIAGTPSKAGAFSFTVRAVDACGKPASASLSIAVLGPGAPPPLSVSPAGLAFAAPANAAGPANQSIAVSSSAPEAYSTTASTSAGGNWLSLAAGAAGTTPGAITVAIANTAKSLPPGLYTGAVVITPQAGTPVTVPVTLNIVAPPMLMVSPAALSFVQMSSSTAPAQQTVNVTSSSGSGAYTLSTAPVNGSAWLFVTPDNGAAPGAFTVSVNAAQLQAGVYTGAITVALAGANPQTIPVMLTVAAQPAVSSVTNAASFAPGPVAPGEFVTIFGAALGPPVLTTLSLNPAGFIDTQLSGTRVLFDDTPAPIVYTSSKQLTAIVPYEIAGRASTRVVVEYQGARSNPIEVRVADAVPGIFADPSGQGAVLNQDGSPNSAQNGAEPGSVVSIFATGEGQTNPGGMDGQIVSTVLAKPALPAGAQIGGQPAEILYAGSAPGGPAGFFQVNARVPPGAPRGKPIAVVVTVGGAMSQAGVTLFIKP